MKITFGLTDQLQDDLHSDLKLIEDVTEKEYWNYNLKRQELDREKISIEYELYDLPCVKNILPIIHNLIQKPHLKMCGLSHQPNAWLPSFNDTLLRLDYIPIMHTVQQDDYVPTIELPETTKEDLDHVYYETEPGKIYMPLFPIYTRDYRLEPGCKALNQWYFSKWDEQNVPHYYPDLIRGEFYLDLRFPVSPDKYNKQTQLEDLPTTRYEQQFLDLGFTPARLYYEVQRKILIGECKNYKQVMNKLGNNRYITRATWSIE